MCLASRLDFAPLFEPYERDGGGPFLYFFDPAEGGDRE